MLNFPNPIYDSLLHGRQLVASDGHYKDAQFVAYRVDRRLRTEASIQVSKDLVLDFLRREISEVQMGALEERGYVDVALDFRGRSGLEKIGRLRVNARYSEERNGLNLSIRFIPDRVFTPDEFEIGPYVRNTTLQLHRGMDLIFAPMGMAKSSLRNALLQSWCDLHGVVITSYEDPIEQRITPKRGLIEQIALGSDVEDCYNSDRVLRRTDTDIVSYGELRDAATKRAALAAARSMLVLATGHASSAVEGIDDYIESFPPDEQPEIRSGLAGSLHSVFVLRAVPRKKALSVEERNGRQNVRIVSEILHVTEAVRHAIRRGETYKIRAEQMNGPGREAGSRTLEAHMAELYFAGEIDIDDPLVRREIRYRDHFESECKRVRETAGGRQMAVR